MKLAPILKIALRALARNKARSLLTMLGIIIGVGSVIAMVSLGQGAQRQVQEQISSMGTNLLIVSSGSQRTGGMRSGAGTSTTLTRRGRGRDRARMPGGGGGQPQRERRAHAGLRQPELEHPRRRREPVPIPPSATGPSPRASSSPTPTCAPPRASPSSARPWRTSSFPGTDPVGQTMRVRNLPFRVVGVLGPKGQSQMGQDQDDTLLMPYTTAMKKAALHHPRAQSPTFRPSRRKLPSARRSRSTDLLRQRHNIRPGAEDDFTVRNLTDIADMAAARRPGVMTLLLGSIAGVSLLVGGIGIMNIMLVSVTERTREIGIRMAVGARSGHVRMQFLIESVVLSLTGGVIGIVFGVGLSFLLSRAFGWPQSISLASILASVIFSVAVGVFFGYYPARKAASLDPIEALRYE